jgi:hypothetical protein
MCEFDHGKYAERLKALADLGHREYRMFFLEVPRFQAMYLRTYLWLASLLAAFELTCFAALARDGYGLPFLDRLPSPWFYSVAALALAATFAAFVLATDTLRGKGSTGLPLDNLPALAQDAYQDASGSTQTMYNNIIIAFSEQITAQAGESSRIARRLRAMSLFLLASVACAAIAVAALAMGPPR